MLQIVSERTSVHATTQRGEQRREERTIKDSAIRVTLPQTNGKILGNGAHPRCATPGNPEPLGLCYISHISGGEHRPMVTHAQQ